MPYVEYDEVELVCTDCGRSFRTEEALTSHRAETHSGIGPGPAKAAPGPTVRCSLCKRAFPSVSALSRHNRATHVA